MQVILVKFAEEGREEIRTPKNSDQICYRKNITSFLETTNEAIIELDFIFGHGK